MPTKHQRIAVTKDAELTEALARVESLFPDRPASTIVHDLAVRGAEAVVADERRRREAMAWLVAWSTGDEMDREALMTVRETAWR